MTTEAWLPVVGYEGLYEVSDRGGLWSVRRGRMMKQRKRRDGRLNVDLYNKHGTQTSMLVHRLVLIAHSSPQPDGMECCHKNGDPTDNVLTNLYWGTRLDNTADRRRHGHYDFAVGTHCKNNHKYTPDNIWLHPNVRGRQCRQCKRDACKRSYRKRRNAIQSSTDKTASSTNQPQACSA